MATYDNADLKKAGLKITVPRLKILDLLEQAETRHMSAEEVYKQLMGDGNDVGLATVYRVLTQFETAGLVLRHNFEGGHSVFELNHDDHHDHMVCSESGEVIEFCDPVIEKRQREIAAEHGFTLVDHSLILYVKPKSEQKQ